MHTDMYITHNIKQIAAPSPWFRKILSNSSPPIKNAQSHPERKMAGVESSSDSSEDDDLWEFTPRKQNEHSDSDDSDMEDSRVTNRSAKLRDERPHEYIPIPHGGENKLVIFCIS